MLGRRQRMMTVYAPSGEYGAKGERLGEFPLSMSYRTSEEVESDGLLYTNLRITAYAGAHRAPAGGYLRGMTITNGGGDERYALLVPVRAGRLWILKLERVMTDGDGEEGTYV